MQKKNTKTLKMKQRMKTTQMKKEPMNTLHIHVTITHKHIIYRFFSSRLNRKMVLAVIPLLQ